MRNTRQGLKASGAREWGISEEFVEVENRGDLATQPNRVTSSWATPASVVFGARRWESASRAFERFGQGASVGARDGFYTGFTSSSGGPATGVDRLMRRWLARSRKPHDASQALHGPLLRARRGRWRGASAWRSRKGKGAAGMVASDEHATRRARRPATRRQRRGAAVAVGFASPYAPWRPETLAAGVHGDDGAMPLDDIDYARRRPARAHRTCPDKAGRVVPETAWSARPPACGRWRAWVRSGSTGVAAGQSWTRHWDWPRRLRRARPWPIRREPQPCWGSSVLGPGFSAPDGAIPGRGSTVHPIFARTLTLHRQQGPTPSPRGEVADLSRRDDGYGGASRKPTCRVQPQSPPVVGCTGHRVISMGAPAPAVRLVQLLNISEGYGRSTAKRSRSIHWWTRPRAVMRIDRVARRSEFFNVPVAACVATYGTRCARNSRPRDAGAASRRRAPPSSTGDTHTPWGSRRQSPSHHDDANARTATASW